MPRTQKQPKPVPQPVSPVASNGSQTLGEVLTLPETAAYLRLSEADVLQLVQEQGLAARQLGTEWRFLKAAIQDWLRTGSPPKSNKQAWMALAGAWKNDPNLEELRQVIQKQRERLASETES
jgi:excisionase family DNA binding protein